MRAWIYKRISTDKQLEGTSLELQEEKCLAYCAERDWVVERVVDDVHSGFDLDDRQGLREIRGAMREETFDVLVFWAVDRLSRNVNHQGILFYEAERSGVSFESVTEDLNGPAGVMIRAMSGMLAEFERAKIRERTMNGTRKRVEAGKLLAGGHPKFGYEWVDADLKKGAKWSYRINLETAPIVRRIFEEAVNGKSLRRIAEDLMADGIKPPLYHQHGDPSWSHRTIHLILRWPGYKGEAFAYVSKTENRRGKKITSFLPADEWISLGSDLIPPIIDAETWEAVQRRLEWNKRKSNESRDGSIPQGMLLRSGFIFCGHCGKGMRITRSNGLKRYQCQTRKHKGTGCGYQTIRADKVDAAVWRQIAWLLTDSGVLHHEYERQLEQQANRQVEEAPDFERRLTDLKREQANLAEAVGALGDPQAAAPLLERLRLVAEWRQMIEAEQTAFAGRVKASAAQRAAAESFFQFLNRHYDDLESMNEEQRREALHQLGVRVTVWRPDSGRDPWELLVAPPWPREIEMSGAIPAEFEGIDWGKPNAADFEWEMNGQYAPDASEMAGAYAPFITAGGDTTSRGAPRHRATR